MRNKFVYEEYNTKYYNQILIHYLSTSLFKLNLISSLMRSPNVAPATPTAKAPTGPAPLPTSPPPNPVATGIKSAPQALASSQPLYI